MSTTTNRETAPRDRGSVDHRLARLLETTFFARVVPHLAPETLHQLIRYRGLEACGELVTSATPAQLTSLLDLDLWRHEQPGRDEQFDVERFGEWLEVLVETGESVAARTVAALDPHLVVTGLSRYLRVFDPGTFEPTASTDDEPMDRHDMMHSATSRDVLECEVGGYLVRARRTDAWDAIVTLLVALETEHGHVLSHGDAGLPAAVELAAGDRRPRRPAAGAGAAPPRRRDRTGPPAIAPRLRDTRRRARLPADGATARSRASDGRSRSTPSPPPTFAPPTTSGRRRDGRRRVAGATRRCRRAWRRRHPRVDRRGHRPAGRSRRDAGTATGAAGGRRRGLAANRGADR